MTTLHWYRIQPASRDVSELLRDDNLSYAWDPIYDADGNEDVRHGVSVCDSVDSLAEYFHDHDVEHSDKFLDSLVMVTLIGHLSDDDDHDDDAYLINPDAIVDVCAVPEIVRAACKPRSETQS